MWWDVCLQDLDGVQGQSDEEMDSIRLHFPHHWMMSVYCKLFCVYYIYMYIFPSIHCSMSPHFHTRRVSRLLGLALVSWAFARVGVHRLSNRLAYLGVFY